VALACFSPDAGAELVGDQYGSDDVATVEVGFPGQGPHYFLQIHRWREHDWRHEKPIIDDPLIDPGRDLAFPPRGPLRRHAGCSEMSGVVRSCSASSPAGRRAVVSPRQWAMGVPDGCDGIGSGDTGT
jgi:hypothetical protein